MYKCFCVQDNSATNIMNEKCHIDTLYNTILQQKRSSLEFFSILRYIYEMTLQILLISYFLYFLSLSFN